MARSVMEAAQEENKRRLEALFPIKTESADQSWLLVVLFVQMLFRRICLCVSK